MRAQSERAAAPKRELEEELDEALEDPSMRIIKT